MAEQTPCECGSVNTFTSKSAEDDLRRYRKDGPDGVTRTLLDAITTRGIEGASVLDVGGGVGVVQWELLDAGAASVVSVDASEPYVAAARAEAERRGVADRVTSRIGSLEEVADDLEPVDVVTLVRVVCCDADVAGLLSAAGAKARQMVGIVYPRVTWWNRLAAMLFAGWGRLTGDSKRWYLHAEEDIDFLLRSAAFERHVIDRTLIWKVVLYTKRQPALDEAARRILTPAG